MTIQQTLLSSGGTNWYLGSPIVSSSTITDANGNTYAFFLASSRQVYFTKFNSLGEIQFTSTAMGSSGSGDSLNITKSTTDASGNIYAVGTILYLGYRHFWVTKWNSTGSILWSYIYRESLTSQALNPNGVKVDSSGNIYVAGLVRPAGGYTNQGFIIKFNSSGAILWQNKYIGSNPTATDTNFNNLILDSSENIYVAGGSNDYTSTTAGTNPILVKFNSSGAIQWQRRIYYTASTSTSSYHGLFTDASDNVYVSGIFNTGSGDIYPLIKYNASGVLQNTTNTSFSGFLYSPTFNIDGNIYAGYIFGLVSIDASFNFLWYTAFLINSTVITQSFANLANGTAGNLIYSTYASAPSIPYQGFFANIPTSNSKRDPAALGTATVYNVLQPPRTFLPMTGYVEQAATLVAGSPTPSFYATAYTTSSSVSNPSIYLTYI